MPGAAARRAVRWVGWALLWGVASVGLLISLLALLAALPATRPAVAAALIRQVDEAVAGRLELDGIAVLPHGGVEVRGLRVFDPEGAQVLRVDRARLFANAFAIAAREVRVSVELDGVDADAASRGPDGALSIARAFAPARPARARRPPEAGGPGAAREGEASGWIVRVGRLAISNGRILADAGGARPLEADALALEARGLWSARTAWVEARLTANLAAPLAAPASLALRAVRDGDRLELERLAVELGADRLEAVGEGDLARRSGRVAVTRLGVSPREAGTLAPGARLAGELAGTLYAESDGTVATAALEVVPDGAGAAGRARVAAAAGLPPAKTAWGLVAEIDRLDPSRLSLLAPPGRVTLHASGAAVGTRLAELSGRLALTLERSRLRGGQLGPVELRATAGGGNVDVSRLEATLPGGTVGGHVSWREGKEVAGRLTVVAADLDVLERNLAGLLGRPVPHLSGTGRAEVSLSGTSRAPVLDASVNAARLEVADVRAEGARLRVQLQGPAEVLSGRVEGALERARVGELELRGVDLEAALGEEEGSLSFTANAPRLGTELVRAMLRGRFGPRRAWFDLADAAIAWPGTRFELVQPARIGIGPPGVDRLLLAAGDQRIELTGGLQPGGKLDARVRLANLDLARLPRGLVPPEVAAEGMLTVDARASGTRAAPRVEATIGLTSASAYGVGGLQLLGDAAWDGGRERIEADLGLVREHGGAVDLSLDLPVALGRAGARESVRVEVTGRAVPLDELVWLAGSYALVSGDVDLHATLQGDVGDPSLSATIAVRNGTWDDLEGLALDASLEASGDRLRANGRGALTGAGAATVQSELALDLPALLSRPAQAVAEARRSPFSLSLQLPAAALAPLASRLSLAPDLAGRLAATASLAGTLAAPRGTATLTLEDGAGWGARAVGARLDVALAPDRSGATLDLRLAGKPAARVDATIALPAERLAERAALAQAQVRADVALPRSELGPWGGELLALKGTVEGRATLRGTASAPQAECSLTASGAAVEGRPLGDVTVVGRYAARRATAAVELQPPLGGKLHADAALDRPLGLGAEAGPLLESPAEVRVKADALDLGFLPALAPGLVRAASGAATLDLVAAGPVGELRPRGSFRVAKGRLALAELGDWTDAAIEADLGDDAITLRRFDVKKGKGTLSLTGSVRGLSRGGQPAEVEAKAVSRDFGVERAGMEFARFDLTAEARGQLERHRLTLGVVVPQAEVKLPKRIPRTLQELDARKDITVGRPRPQRARRAPRPVEAAATAAPPPGTPFTSVIHLVAPRRFRVRADQPRIDIELKADALFAFSAGREEATGTIEAIRGQIEPIGGRVFELERGKVTFNGGRIAAGALDVAARYDNPTAKVHALLEGTLGKPQLRLSSEPPLEEAQVAMLIATGRTEVKAGEAGINSLTGGDAGLAAAGAVVTGMFKDLLSDKLPIDSVSLDSTALTAGKYLTDRIYVGYVRKFDAKPEKGENPDEVRIEYQLAPGWQVETRYGTGQSGGASIVWTKNY